MNRSVSTGKVGEVSGALNLMHSIAKSLKPITVEEEHFKTRVLKMSDYFQQAWSHNVEENQDEIDIHSAKSA